MSVSAMVLTVLLAAVSGIIFGLSVRKYRKSYCNYTGIGVCISVVQMLKFLVIVFICLYLLNMWRMDHVDTLHVGRYWSEILCCTITTDLGNLEVKTISTMGTGTAVALLVLSYR